MRRASVWASIGVAVTTSAVVAMERDAEACECVEHVPIVRPSSVDVVVPANTKIWLEGPAANFATCGPLLGPGAQPVAATRSELLDRDARFVRAVVLTPDADLLVGAEYSMTCDFYGSPLHTSFTVTDPADQLAPSVPQAHIGAVEHDGSSGSSCGESDYALVELQHEGGIVVLDIAGQSQLTVDAPSGSVNDVYGADGFLIGHQVCGRHYNWSFDDDGPAKDVRFGSFDLAGNFSGWSEPQEVSAGCSCRLAPTGAASGQVFAMVGLALVGFSRRRGRPR